MTIQISVKNLGENNRKVDIEMNQGPGYSIPPGSAEIITLHAGQFITKISEGAEAPPLKPDAEFQPSEDQKAEIAELLVLYGDVNVGVGLDGIYAIVSKEDGSEIAKGSFGDLKAAKEPKQSDEGAGAKEGDETPAKEPESASADGSAAGDESKADPNAAPKNVFTVKKPDGTILDGFSDEGQAAITAALESAQQSGETPLISVNDGEFFPLGSPEANAALESVGLKPVDQSAPESDEPAKETPAA